MQPNILLFAFDSFLLRVMRCKAGGFLFCAKDVALPLGYQWSGIRTIQHVPEDWRSVESVSTPFGARGTWFFTEDGIYFFLGRCDKPKALGYQKWLTTEVLPSLRKVESLGMSSGGSDVGRGLPPQLRARILSDSLRQASLVGASTNEEIEAIFKGNCAKFTNGSSVPPPLGRLDGIKAISRYAGVSQNTLRRLIKEQNFPAGRMGDLWISSTDLIDKWRYCRMAQ